MNPRELNSILKKARLPEISKESLEMFPRRILARLADNEAVAARTNRVLPRFAWAIGLATALFIIIGIGHRHAVWQTETISPHDSLANIKLIRETLAVFPNQVRALVEDEQGIKLELADTGNIPDSPPLYVRICDGKHCMSFVTFSGQEIQAAGQHITVLADPRGGVLLAANHFVWSSDDLNIADSNLKIVAKNLGANVM